MPDTPPPAPLVLVPPQAQLLLLTSNLLMHVSAAQAPSDLPVSSSRSALPVSTRSLFLASSFSLDLWRRGRSRRPTPTRRRPCLTRRRWRRDVRLDAQRVTANPPWHWSGAASRSNMLHVKRRITATIHSCAARIRAHTLTHYTLTRLHTYTLTHLHTYALTLRHTYTHTHTYTLTLGHTDTHTYTLDVGSRGGASADCLPALQPALLVQDRLAGRPPSFERGECRAGEASSVSRPRPRRRARGGVASEAFFRSWSWPLVASQ